MACLSNYYQLKSERKDLSTPGRYPMNHVRFSPLLAPLKWISGISESLGKRAFSLEKDMLQEFDKSSPVDKYIGTEKDLADMRKLLISYCRGLDNNSNLSAIGRFLLKKIAIDALKNRRKILKVEDKRSLFLYEKLFFTTLDAYRPAKSHRACKKIYKKFDLAYTDEFEKRMIQYLQNNQQGKYGRHQYSLEEYGFEANQVYDDFSEYMKHYSYNIPEHTDRPNSVDFLKNLSD